MSEKLQRRRLARHILHRMFPEGVPSYCTSCKVDIILLVASGTSVEARAKLKLAIRDFIHSIKREGYRMRSHCRKVIGR